MSLYSQRRALDHVDAQVHCKPQCKSYAEFPVYVSLYKTVLFVVVKSLSFSFSYWENYFLNSNLKFLEYRRCFVFSPAERKVSWMKGSIIVTEAVLCVCGFTESAIPNGSLLLLLCFEEGEITVLCDKDKKERSLLANWSETPVGISIFLFSKIAHIFLV